jgi:AcrR family transcriptional regulator
MGRPKNFNREEVLEKAMPLFWQRGFAETGLQDLEQATGVNKSGLYAEFKNKDDLFIEALRHYIKSRKNARNLALEPLGIHNIDTFFKKVIANESGNKGCFCVNSMCDIDTLPTEAQEILLAHRKGLKQLFLKNLEAEKTKMSPEALTEIVSTFFSGLCVEQNIKPGKSAASTKKVDEFLSALRSL